MTYTELIHKLFNINLLGGIKFGLNNMRQLLEALHHPEKSFKSIHIAGTNGKGSVTTKIAKGLEGVCPKVGLFTSPHINTFRERIQINGSLISEADTIKLLNQIFKIQEKLAIPATFFELTTALGFLYFAESGVEYAAIETGLGGRLDATNVILPELSIITSIALDHTEILGDSVEKIALEKAGIIKEGVPVVIGPRVPYAVIAEVAKQRKAKLEQIQLSYTSYIEENNAIAKAAMRLLQLPETAIDQGIKASPPCRFELVEKDPPVICDVAHNPDGLTALFKRVKQEFPASSFRVVLGLSKSKDVQGCMKLVAEQKPIHLYFVEAKHERAASASDLKQIALQLGMEESRISVFSTVSAGIQQAKKHREILLITGTFFMMSEARKELGLIEVCDSISLN